jgi:acyl-CoA dehydrogenase
MNDLNAASTPDLLARAAHVAEEVAGPHAAEVDRLAVFPAAAFAAVRNAGLLSMMVPVDQGGAGADLADVARAAEILARQCAATALIFAMHQIQVACLVHHGDQPVLRDLLRDVVGDKLLLGSATSESGIGGDIRRSRCALQVRGEAVTVEKDASVVSYGTDADAILLTARRTADSHSGDQVLVACRGADLEIRQAGQADMLGLRGTRSVPYRLIGRAPAGAVFEHTFDRILAETMMPYSHVLWSSVWLGLASAALAKAARFVQAGARRTGAGASVPAERLANLSATRQTMRALVEDATRAIGETAVPDRSAPRFIAQLNHLKVSVSSMAVEVVSGALMVTGTAGYRDEGEFAMGRLLRDVYGGVVMVNNDRLTATTAQLLLAVRSW